MKTTWHKTLRDALEKYKTKTGESDHEIGRKTKLGQAAIYRFREARPDKAAISFPNAEILARFLGFDMVKKDD